MKESQNCIRSGKTLPKSRLYLHNDILIQKNLLLNKSFSLTVLIKFEELIGLWFNTSLRLSDLNMEVTCDISKFVDYIPICTILLKILLIGMIGVKTTL